jgi:predicted RNA-binding Zn ribbon-like protein
MNVEWLTEQVEGKEAPTPLLAVQAFANTLDVESGTDLLESADSFNEWLHNAGLAEPGVVIPEDQMDETRRLRQVVRRLLAANERGEKDEKAAKSLAKIANACRVSLAVGEDGELHPDLSPADGAGDLVCLMLGIVYHAQTTGNWSRLKLCENPDCAWAFYDNSRNRSGSWCRMGLCGNRLKNRAYRERQRKSGG